MIAWLTLARSRRTILIPIVAAFAAASPAWAQSGSVSGQVTGADRGGPLAGAVVTDLKAFVVANSASSSR